MEKNIEGITLIVNPDFLYVCGRGWWCRCEMDADMGFPDSSVGKEYVWNVGDLGLIPGLRRSPGEGKGYPLQYLENSMDCIVHGVTKSDMTERLSASLSLSWKEKVKSGWENAPCLIWSPFFHILYVFVWKIGHWGGILCLYLLICKYNRHVIIQKILWYPSISFTANKVKTLSTCVCAFRWMNEERDVERRVPGHVLVPGTRLKDRAGKKRAFFFTSTAGEEYTCNAGDPDLIPGFRKIPWRRDRLPTPVFLSFVAQQVKNPPAMRGTWAWSLGWEDALEKGKATYSSILA